MRKLTNYHVVFELFVWNFNYWGLVFQKRHFIRTHILQSFLNILLVFIINHFQIFASLLGLLFHASGGETLNYKSTILLIVGDSVWFLLKSHLSWDRLGIQSIATSIAGISGVDLDSLISDVFKFVARVSAFCFLKWWIIHDLILAKGFLRVNAVDSKRIIIRHFIILLIDKVFNRYSISSLHGLSLRLSKYMITHIFNRRPPSLISIGVYGWGLTTFLIIHLSFVCLCVL